MDTDTITGAQLREWRKGQDLTQAEAAEAHGRSSRQWIDYEKGKVAIPPALAERVLGKPLEEAAPNRIKVARARIEEVTADRPRPPGKPFEHPLIPAGTVVYLQDDWPFARYPQSLPKGRWRIILKQPIIFKNGAECTSIEYCSNGVGAPSSILIGHVRGAKPLPGLEGMSEGAYHPWRGDPARQSADIESRLKGAAKAKR